MPRNESEMPVTEEKTESRPRKSRVAKIAEDLKTVAEDTIKEAEEKIEATAEKVKDDVVKPEKKRSKKPSMPAVMIQSIMGGEITLDEILRRISEQAVDQPVTSVYIKAEENRAYYVAGIEGGYIELWQ